MGNILASEGEPDAAACLLRLPGAGVCTAADCRGCSCPVPALMILVP